MTTPEVPPYSFMCGRDDHGRQGYHLAATHIDWGAWVKHLLSDGRDRSATALNLESLRVDALQGDVKNQITSSSDYHLHMKVRVNRNATLTRSSSYIWLWPVACVASVARGMAKIAVLLLL